MLRSALLLSPLGLSACLLGVQPRLPEAPRVVSVRVVEPLRREADGLAHVGAGERVEVELELSRAVLPAASLLTLEGVPLTLVDPDATAPTTVLRVARVLLRDDSHGARILSATLVDEVRTEDEPFGRTTRVQETLDLITDFRAPTASCVLAPEVTSAETPATLRVSPSEPLAGDVPTLRIATPLLEATYVDREDGAHVWRLASASAVELRDYRVEVLGRDLAGNAPVDEVLCTVQGSLLALPPALAEAPVLTVVPAPGDPVVTESDGTPRVRAGAVVSVRLRSMAPVVPGLSVVSLSDVQLDAVTLDPGTVLDWRRTVAGDDPDGLKRLDANLVDVVGNRTRIRSADLAVPVQVLLDLTPPELASAALQRSPFFGPADPGDGTLWITDKDPFTDQDVLTTLVVTATEDLGAPPELSVVGPSTSRWTRTGVTARQATWTLDALPTRDGTYTFEVELRDRVGNVATVPLEVQLRVDRQAPPEVAVDQPDRVVQHRIPWGSRATGGQARHRVDGGPGAVLPGATVALLDGLGNTLATRVADAAGAFADLRAAADLPAVYVVQVDAAGNASTPVRVRDATWTASMGGKVVGSPLPNPHTLWRTDALGSTRAIADAVEVGSPVATLVGNPGAWTRWDPVPDGEVPLARRGHGMVQDTARGVTVLFGGRADESGVCGREGSAYCGDTWEHDGSRWIRRDPPTSPTPRADHAMVYDAARGRVILQGGVVDMDQDCVPLDGNRCGDTWAWDGSTWEQLTPDVRPPGRMLHAMAYDPARAQVVLFGGCDETGGGCAFGSAQRADTWVFDGSTWTEMAPPTSPPRRVRHAMAYDPVRGEVVLFGGTNAGNGGCGAGDVEQCSDTWAWDGSTWTERTPASAPAERENPAMAWDGARGAVVMTGGRRAPGKKCNGSNERECDDLWVWDGSTWTEDVRPEVPPRRAEAQLVFDPERGRLLLFGGRGSLGGPCADVGGTSCEGLWADAGGVWTELRALSEQPPARTAAPIAYDAARGRGVLFGGYGVPIGRCGVLGSGYCNDTWEWTPAGWLQRTPASSPPARSGLASAWDAQREVTVVFGGYADEMADCPPFDARVCADTWTWDGTSWTEHVVDPSPPARRAAAFAHDPVRGQTVLFGGTSASNARCDGANEDCGDTWTWDGAAWTKQTPSGAPGRRDRSAMAFDAAHGVMVLFGGEVASRGGCGIVDSRSCGDTWVWDGSGWTEQHPLVSPPARAGHGLAYDEVRGTVLLFGGEVEEVGACGDPSGTRCNDLWSWDGVTWTALGAQPSPPARQEVGLIHDPVLDVLLASGGYGERDGACGNDTRPECRDTWLWKGRSSPTAAMVLEVPWDAARVPEARIRAVGATWRAGGEGHPGGVTRPGAELVVWDGGAWVAVDAHAAPPSSPEDLCWTALVDASVPEGAGCATEVDPVRPGRVLGFSAQGAAAFAVRPAAPAGLQEGALVSEDVEVRVRYRLDP